VSGSGSGSCPVMGVDISASESSGSASYMLVSSGQSPQAFVYRHFTIL
jgi:hypothetical protein